MNDFPKVNEPLELIAPLPIEWEIKPVLENVWTCATGQVATCSIGGGN